MGIPKEAREVLEKWGKLWDLPDEALHSLNTIVGAAYYKGFADGVERSKEMVKEKFAEFTK